MWVCGLVLVYSSILNWGTVYVLEVVYKLFSYVRDLYSITPILLNWNVFLLFGGSCPTWFYFAARPLHPCV